jgi:5-methylcytosine rRNA methyltransferase NSUN4
MANKGALAFDQFFQSVYGEAWPALKAALLKEERQIPRKNKFEAGAPGDVGQGEIPRGAGGLLAFYIMDQASILAAQALAVEPQDKVLDMCAAPGGKTLILAEALGVSGELIANEISEARRQRLKKVIQQYLPRHVRDHVFMTGKDGGKFALTHRDYFDKILVDAPCSGERHLLQNRKELEAWSESRSKKLAQRQYALLTAALLACRPQGRIVYSTCSISPFENDGVIEVLLKKKTGFEVLKEPVAADGQETRFGQIFLPHVSGMGPIFFSVLKKN